MGLINKQHTFSDDTNANPLEVNANFDDIYNEFNGNIEDVNHADITVDDEDTSTWSLTDKPGKLFNRIFTKVKDVLGTSDWSIPISLSSLNTWKSEIDEWKNDVGLWKSEIDEWKNDVGFTTDILKNVYPVGSIYINANDDTNPSELLGFGTWEQFGKGRVLVGQNSDDTDFDTAEKTGGEKEHTLTIDEMPSHGHTAQGSVYEGSSGTSDHFRQGSDTEGRYTTDGVIRSTGGGQPHNNVQPYIVVYMWKRTA